MADHNIYSIELGKLQAYMKDMQKAVETLSGVVKGNTTATQSNARQIATIMTWAKAIFFLTPLIWGALIAINSLIISSVFEPEVITKILSYYSPF